MTIFVFGNQLLKEDSLPLKLLPQLRKDLPEIDFIVADPNENFPPKGVKDLIILDTVLGITEPRVLDLNNLKEQKTTPISPHDYDLMFHLQLLIKLKKISSVKIIAVPPLLNSTSLLESVLHKTCKDQKRG